MQWGRERLVPAWGVREAGGRVAVPLRTSSGAHRRRAGAYQAEVVGGSGNSVARSQQRCDPSASPHPGQVGAVLLATCAEDAVGTVRINGVIYVGVLAQPCVTRQWVVGRAVVFHDLARERGGQVCPAILAHQHNAGLLDQLGSRTNVGVRHARPLTHSSSCNSRSRPTRNQIVRRG